MFSVQHTSASSEDQTAAGHAPFFPFISKCYHAEGGLGLLTNFIHNYFSSQPSRSTTLLSKRVPVNNNNNIDTITSSNSSNNYNNGTKLISRFHHSTTVFDRTVYMIGGQSLLVNSSSSDDNNNNNNGLSLAKDLVVFDFSLLDISEQNSNLFVTGHGAVPSLNGSEVLIFFGKEESASTLELSNPGIKLVDVKTGNVTIPNNIKGQTPQPRYHHSTTLFNNKVYIIGGLDKDNNILSDIAYLDLSSNTWVLPNVQQQQQQQQQQQRIPIAGHSTVVIDRYLVSCFGFNQDKLFNNCNVYDTSNNSYISTKVNGAPPSPRTYSSMILTPDSSDNNTVIVFGGLDENSKGNNELYALDTSKLPDLLSWAPITLSSKLNVDKSLIPSPRGGHSAFTINDNNTNLMMIWGGFSDNDFIDSEIYFFDVKSSSWIDNVAAGYPKINIEYTLPDEHSGYQDSDTSVITIVIGTVCGFFFITGTLLGFLLIRRRRKLKDGKEILNDPYIRPGGKLGSNLDLGHEEAEHKSVQNSNQKDNNDGDFSKINKSSHHKQHNNNNINDDDNNNNSNNNNNNDNSNNNSNNNNINNNNSNSNSNSNNDQEYPTPPLSPSITDDENDSEPTENREPPASTNNSNISDASNTKDLPPLPTIPEPVTSKESIPQKIKRSHKRSSSVSLTAFDIANISQAKQFSFPKSPLSIDKISNNHNNNNNNNNYDITKRRHSNSFNNESFRWTMNNNNNNNNKKHSSLRDYHYNSKPQDDEYTIHGDYIDTASTKIRYNDNDETPNNSLRKSKRFSKGRSRVSFSLNDEKIEYNESDSSKSVSLVRMSRSSYQSSSSSNSHSSLSSISNTPSTIEEEEEETNSVNCNDNNFNDKNCI